MQFADDTFLKREKRVWLQQPEQLSNLNMSINPTLLFLCSNQVAGPDATFINTSINEYSISSYIIRITGIYYYGLSTVAAGTGTDIYTSEVPTTTGVLSNPSNYWLHYSFSSGGWINTSST